MQRLHACEKCGTVHVCALCSDYLTKEWKEADKYRDGHYPLYHPLHAAKDFVFNRVRRLVGPRQPWLCDGCRAGV